jgi:GTP pyrophosphokinase
MSIKLADRLHNMRTLGVMRPEKQARIAKVTRDVLIPLAERLGVQALKTELEDLVFAILHPEEYERTRALIAENSTACTALAAIADDFRAALREAGISAEVLIRPRHFVSVHRVCLKRSQLRSTDFGRLLILVGEDADCYAVLGELHTCFTPVISEFKDFIAAPKFNLYQSLHTAVAGPDGAVAEVLIRTHQMHKVAEAGVVALGNPYVPVEGAEPADCERADPTRPGWLSRLLEWQ